MLDVVNKLFNTKMTIPSIVLPLHLKLFRPYFEFSLKGKRSNPGDLLKSSLFQCPRLPLGSDSPELINWSAQANDLLGRERLSKLLNFLSCICRYTYSEGFKIINKYVNNCILNLVIGKLMTIFLNLIELLESILF